MCEDCEIEGFGELFKNLEELSRELEEIAPIIADAIEYLILTNLDVFRKAKSPLFRLLLQVYRQQLDILSLLYEYRQKYKEATVQHGNSIRIPRRR